ncbi:MAG: hypothetical protein CME65_05340 [Halobacteriovoraceae bacterium]|nr:hypothetical protein [Halobacteriovoraceae bacterium]|tara:strand:+ start:5978 stop:7726 length:1749 start_codon:yes stop_codon:yes gene_type:complete
MKYKLLKSHISTSFFIYSTCLFAILNFKAFASPDWSASATLPGNIECHEVHGKEVCLSDGNRANIWQASDQEWEKLVKRGAEHALNYPVEITRLQLPKTSMDKFFQSDSSSPLRRFVFRIARGLTQFKSFDAIYQWLGLHEFPETTAEYGPNYIPPFNGTAREAMGVSVFNHNGYQGLSFSCAACHSSNLFGTKVMGLTNRFPRANEAFVMGKSILSKTPTFIFRTLVNPPEEDVKIFNEAKTAMKYVRVKEPIALGLDTSLAQVGLSLAIRSKDEYASFPTGRFRPRANPLDRKPADSKPAVWWNLKYKTKWLSDASIQSGNPVHTNFLWNEIGRGADLEKLETWFETNQRKVKELTAYVFATEAPEFNDYFPGQINITRAKRGQKLFLKNCSGCHGIYEKAWDQFDDLSYEESIATVKVRYHARTIVKDVGTDPLRYEGMNYFSQDLNRLQISESIGTVVKPQNGYVPPPLVGIWARYPYFHNNSVPTLYDILLPDYKRPKRYVSVPAIDKVQDFDREKNGYPSPALIREPFRSDREHLFDTRKTGMSNQGHTSMMLDENGGEKFSESEKIDLINFLQTL